MNGREEYLKKRENKIKRFLENNSDKPYLKGFVNYVGDSKSLNTRYDYLLYISRFMNTCGNKEPKDLILDDYTSFFADCSQASKVPAYSALKIFSKYLKAARICEYDIVKEIEAPRHIESDDIVAKREKKFLSDEEIKLYLEAIDKGVGTEKAKAFQAKWTLRDKTIVLLMLNTAFRSTELCSLDVDSIDFENNLIRSKTKKGGGYVTCPITENMASMLSEWLELREEFLDGKEEDALFISNSRTRLSYPALRNIIMKYSKVIEGKEITPHALRATVATQVCTRAGVYVAQQMLGHSSPTMTAKIYVRGQEKESKLEAANVMAALTF